MAVSVNAKVQGAERTLQLLKELDPRLRRETNKTIRRAAAPLVAGVRELIPTEAPLSNWISGRYGWQGTEQRAVRTTIGGRSGARTSMNRGREVKSWPLIAVSTNSPAGSVFDMAGRTSSGQSPQGRAFIRNLDARWGNASRSMWPGAEAEMPAVRSAVMAAVADAARHLNRDLKQVVK